MRLKLPTQVSRIRARASIRVCYVWGAWAHRRTPLRPAILVDVWVEDRRDEPYRRGGHRVVVWDRDLQMELGAVIGGSCPVGGARAPQGGVPVPVVHLAMHCSWRSTCPRMAWFSSRVCRMPKMQTKLSQGELCEYVMSHHDTALNNTELHNIPYYLMRIRNSPKE